MKTQITITELNTLLQAVFERVGTREDAQYLTDAIVYAALSKDERMDPVAEALNDFEVALKKRPTFREVFSSGACRLLDFAASTPFPLMRELHNHLIAASESSGLATLALRNTAGIHQLSSWVQPLMKTKHHVGIFVWNGGSYTVAPFGSTEPFFGTNPIAFAIPTDEDPLICDMATSEVPFMNLMQALRAGTNLSSAAGLNASGERTNIAKEIFDIEADGPVRLLPMGLGYKGGAIMLLIEVLTGALIGAKMGREATDSHFVPEEFGGWLCVFDVRRFCDPGEFRMRVGKMARQIRDSIPAAGVTKIQLPGDRAHDSYRRRLATGALTLPIETEKRLRALAVKDES